VRRSRGGAARAYTGAMAPSARQSAWRSRQSTWAADAARALSEAGYRRGGARRAILDLLDEQPCALSAVEIEHALAARRREVSRASVYRVMDELEEIGLVQRVEIGQGMVRYEPVRHGAGHHHHLVCDRCGRLQPFSDEELESTIRRVSERLALRVSEHEIVLHGACETCARS
jgi:Fur family transcriptional regulator, ferric uptake regulator